MSSYNPKRLGPLDVQGELIERLQAMRWPDPAPATRQHCWELLRAQLDAQAVAADGGERRTDQERGEARFPPVRELRERRLHRYDFASRACGGYSGALAARVFESQRLSRVRPPSA